MSQEETQATAEISKLWGQGELESVIVAKIAAQFPSVDAQKLFNAFKKEL